MYGRVGFIPIVRLADQIHFICSAMKEHEILELVKKKLLSCQLNDTNRAKFIRIRTKFLSVKDQITSKSSAKNRIDPQN
jgi:hypothetical protein